MGNEISVVVKQETGAINFNYEEIKANLTESMQVYKDMTFEEDSKVFAKKEVAMLRKMKKAIDEKRIAVKKECLKPYEDFETKAKELTTLIDEPIKIINDQVSDYEDKRIQEKKAKIQVIYNDSIGDMLEYIPLQKIYDTKWENSSTSIKSICEDIENVASSTQDSVTTITGMNSDAVPEALNRFKNDLSLTNAITYINQFEQQKQAILAKELEKQKAEEERKEREKENRIREEERKRFEEEERIRKEEREKAEKSFACNTVIVEPDDTDSTPQQDVCANLPFAQPDLTVRAVYTIIATEDELKEMETTLNSIGIFFMREGE